MTSRVLPPDEWPRLAGTPLEPLLSALIPDQTVIRVVEDADGQIIGTVGLWSMVHLEGLWIAPEHQGKAAVIRALIDGTNATAAAHDLTLAMSGAYTPEMVSFLERLGGDRQSAAVFYVPLPLQFRAIIAQQEA